MMLPYLRENEIVLIHIKQSRQGAWLGTANESLTNICPEPWRASYYAVTHVRNKTVLFKGGHLIW